MKQLVCVCTRRKGDPERAEAFLQEAVKSYTSEGWSLPVTHTRKQIAECQKLLGRTEEYPSQTVNRPLSGQVCQLYSRAGGNAVRGMNPRYEDA